MEDWALEEEEQRHHDAKMARLAKEKDIHDSMLSALIGLVELLDSHEWGEGPALRDARYVIAKAKGNQ